MLKTLCVFGTRPEAIKMAPIIAKLNTNNFFENKVCVTGQHQQMLYTVLDLFGISPDFNLNVMTTNQDINHLTAKVLTGLTEIFELFSPDILFVHGDTTTTLAATLCAYYHKIPVAHIEAGLRTGDIYLPWPEEGNRKVSDALSTWFFAPTTLAKNNLLQEGVNEDKIIVTGNTVIDALVIALDKIDRQPHLLDKLNQQFHYLRQNHKMILVTGHRRESFGDGFKRICRAITLIAEKHPDIDIVYPVHLNPNVHEPVHQMLGKLKNVYLIETLDYLAFIYLMRRSYLILTDSGGVQEEAPSLGIPVLVMRDKTERQESINAGTVKLVGTDELSISSNVEELLTNYSVYQEMQKKQNPYGDGHASSRIISALESFLREKIEAQ